MTLRQHAEAIWFAGVSAVDSTRLVRQSVHRTDDSLVICGESIALSDVDRVIVVGGGKAGAGMAAGLEESLGDDLLYGKVTGWINVPADCVRPLKQIHLHPARPAGINEPTAEGVVGSLRMLELVKSLTDRDLCLVLISGGGSALMPAPVEGISLADKLAVTRFLMRSGATIHELNTVRKRLSQLKGGGLLRAATAGRMVSLLISDVPNDPLDIIASGPTVCDLGSADDALKVLRKFATAPAQSPIPAAVWHYLQQKAAHAAKNTTPRIICRNCVIGNNQTALDAASAKASALGYEVRSLGSNRQGVAREVGTELAELALAARDESSSRSICLIGGGEPVVKLAPSDKPRRGGRNQELVLAAACRCLREDMQRIAFLSAGTDGEDGPTDAAGAVFDHGVQQQLRQTGLDPIASLNVNDSYTLFSQVEGLFKTGPTHTNVMDLQLALIAGA